SVLSYTSTSAGDPAPAAVAPGKLRLYSMRFCPFAQRPRLVLAAKGIEYETVNIHLKAKPAWFLERCPGGLVPVLENDSGELVPESLVVSDLLDQLYPEPPLYPRGQPYAQAKQRLLIEGFGKVVSLFYKIFSASLKEESAVEVEGEFQRSLAPYEKHLQASGETFLGGARPSMADYMVWPWMERLPAVGALRVLDALPRLKAWWEAMMKDAAVLATFTDMDTYKEFGKRYAANDMESYDIGL
uniref:Glutathione S-transferase omega n=1 Tax=Petromyzon marinus TaxID=7757 RepID=S4RHA9_PETMA